MKKYESGNQQDEGDSRAEVHENYPKSAIHTRGVVAETSLKPRKRLASISEPIDNVEPKTKIHITEVKRNKCGFAEKSPQGDPSKSLPLPKTLSDHYDLKLLNISSASKIHAKVTQALGVLASFPVVTGSKNAVVLLRAKPNACGKMISIVEIVKREISSTMQGKWYQYNVLDHTPEESNTFPKNAKEKTQIAEEGNDIDDVNKEKSENNNASFEKAIFGVSNVKAQPVMSIYLSRVRIEELRKKHGKRTDEQFKESSVVNQQIL
ncbi:hypothetical protein Golomagni_04395 [Golovinomyces magnicellulatus]|nr:hypothetical protein Golomagni_04395 [Golovinomyces magnicellulatus]